MKDKALVTECNWQWQIKLFLINGERDWEITKAIVTGSAACQVRLIRIFTAARIVIMEGYGLTETSPVISCEPV